MMEYPYHDPLTEKQVDFLLAGFPRLAALNDADTICRTLILYSCAFDLPIRTGNLEAQCHIYANVLNQMNYLYNFPEKFDQVKFDALSTNEKQ